jgi:hypothetical protein
MGKRLSTIVSATASRPDKKRPARTLKPTGAPVSPLWSNTLRFASRGEGTCCLSLGWTTSLLARIAAGMRRMFSRMQQAVARILDPVQLRWIGFNHFEGTNAVRSTNGFKILRGYAKTSLGIITFDKGGSVRGSLPGAKLYAVRYQW